MKKWLALILISLTLAFKGSGQGTLVYHTSFEIDSSRYCDHNSTNMNFDSVRLENFYNDIFTVLNSVDIFSYCNASNYANNIPRNVVGFQYPFDLNNYIGLTVAIDTVNYLQSRQYREWVGINPHYDFIKDKFYKISFYISVADTSGLYSTPPQAYITADSLFYDSFTFNTDFSVIGNANLSVTDTINIYSDTINWVQVSTIYKSNGNEKYVYLGNFSDSKHTKWVFINNYIPQFSQPFSYFYIDDLSIYELDSTVSIEENPTDNIQIYPNPTQNYLIVDAGKLTTVQVDLFDISGRKLLQQMVTTNQEQVDVSGLASGVYIAVVRSGGQVVKRQKLIIQK